jgi:hypothetical protein
VHRGVNFASQTVLNKIHIQFDVMKAQARIAQSVLILGLQLGLKMSTRLMDFSSTTSKPVLCMLCQLLRKVVGTCNICAQSFVGF